MLPNYVYDSSIVCQGQVTRPPNYCNDLNAMHEAERIAFEPYHDGSGDKYGYELVSVIVAHENCERHEVQVWFATAAQRAEAFLRTIGKWKETP